MNQENKFMVGIGSSALVGKDTLYKVLSNILKEKAEIERVSLADSLKSEVNDFTTKQYNISAFTKNPQEKEIIRPLFVIHGKIKRQISKNLYWTGLLQERINDLYSENIIPICTDIRFAESENDEIFWLKNINNGVYIHVNRFDKEGNKIKPANLEEEKNTAILEKMADFTLNWPTSNDLQFLEEIVRTQLSELLNMIIKKYNNGKLNK